MARKNPFANLMNERPLEPGVALDYTVKGASRSIISTIDELAHRADKLLEGETVIELDPDVIDASFVRDRIEDDPQAFEALVEAIREQGQNSPILVRPHPKDDGRYMVVFGHRRLRAVKALGRKVRAGTIWMNTFMDGASELPFGGYKQSGLGRELGRHAVEDYTETKTLNMHIGARTGWWMPR